MTVHTYMQPDSGDLELFSYAYDVTEHKLNEIVMDRIADNSFDYIGIIRVHERTFEFLKRSPDIHFSELRRKISYDTFCDHIRNDYIDPEELPQYDEATSLETILQNLKDRTFFTATYRRVEKGRTQCKQMDYLWLDDAAQKILVVRSDVTAAFEREQQQLARIEAARLEAERANEAKSDFLSSMSHDLRTPLNGVLGFTAFALRESDPRKIQTYLQKIDSSGRLLLDLINDTLELSRIESGKAALEPEVVMPDDLIPAVVTALRPSAELKQIRLETDFPGDAMIPVWCDKLKVQKIALNLISNAVKYTHPGGRVSVSLIPAPETAPACKWSLCVEDDGIGMSEEFMTHMFEPFAQEKRSESVNTPGTGLGLAIVRRYVDLMGGTIAVTSKVHRGTRWVVSLPICEARDAHQLKEEQDAAMQSLAGKRVLLCEDNALNTEIAAILLKDKGIIMDSAENGEAGLKRFCEMPEDYYDAVLMDLRMPVMDGKTATRRIRGLQRADAGRIPIIAMTADAFEESVREAREAGMDDYITKPIEPRKLFSALQQCLKADRAADSPLSQLQKEDTKH